MSEYLPVREEGDRLPLTASATITGGQLVVASGVKTVAPSSGASAAWVGVALADAASGALVTIHCEGVHRLTASGTVTAGNTVESAASGQVAAHTNGTNDVNVIGVALTTATTGNPVDVLFR
jgi:predicted RecA/RadA family phage recombinase